MADNNENSSIRIEYSEDGSTIIFNNLTGEKIAEFNNSALQLSSEKVSRLSDNTIVFASSADKYLDYAGLQLYTEKIKAYLTAADEKVNARSIKTVLIDGDIIKFYKKQNAALKDTPDYEVTITAADIQNLKELLDGFSGKSAVKNTVDNVEKVVADSNSGITELKNSIGDFSSAATVTETINELKEKYDDLSEGGVITLSISKTPTEGYSKTYVLTQGTTELGKIDIPEELVVKSGEIITIDEAHATTELPVGTYIKLVIENQEEPVYINVKDLVNVYTVQENAVEVQLSINQLSSSREISAKIAAGGVNADKIADNAVVTEKIFDKAISKTNADSSIQSSLDLADSAVQYDEYKAIFSTLDSTVSTDAVDGVDITLASITQLGETQLALSSASINTVTEDEIKGLFDEKVVNLWQKQKNT